MQARRVFLRQGLELSGALLLGCNAGAGTESTSRDGGPDDAGVCTIAHGAFAELLPFVGESEVPLETAFNSGLDGRLYTDLSQIGPDMPLVSNDAFYIRTRYPDLLQPEDPWVVAVTDVDGSVQSVVFDEVQRRAGPRGKFVLECSGNGSGASFGLLSSAEWDGAPLVMLLDDLGLERSGTRVLVSGFDQHSEPSAGNRSQPGASWIFSWDDLEQTAAFLATRMNGEALPKDHGAPVRLYVPGWYGCTCIKWVNEIRIVPDDVEATSQMTEFASRTHQPGTPELARDFIAASMDTAAMPTRVERWTGTGRDVYRVFGIVWGGDGSRVDLEVRFGDGDYEAVERCAVTRAAPFQLWEHWWQPTEPGEYGIVLRVRNPGVRTRRLDTGFYERVVRI